MKNKSTQHLRKSEKGQSVTEYIILVGILAIGSMFVVSKLGEAIKTATGNMVNVFTGQEGDTHRNVEAIQSEHMRRTDLWESIRRRPPRQK